jgi:hypothetical protein
MTWLIEPRARAMIDLAEHRQEWLCYVGGFRGHRSGVKPLLLRLALVAIGAMFCIKLVGRNTEDVVALDAHAVDVAL